MYDVLFVSKPVAPPWNDSNKNLVRDLSRALTRHRPRVLVPSGAPLSGVTSEQLYEGAGEYAPAFAANARVMARLLVGRRADLWHFFFAPNPVTLLAGRAARLAKGTPTVHTIASAPDSLEAVSGELFADSVVVLSEHTKARLEKVGVESRVVPPALVVPEVSEGRVTATRARYKIDGRYALYAGDLEFGDGAKTFVRAAAADTERELQYVVASRPKTARAQDARARLEREAVELGANIVWLGEIDDIHALVKDASVLSLVTDTLHAKMDWPLVLLEALALGVPCVVGAGTAAAELKASGACEPIRTGDPKALGFALRAWSERNDAVRARLDEASRWVDATCKPSVVASQYEEIYDEVVDRVRRGRKARR
ncbi:MAG: glycosyltransferase family 4 protein [Myxococcales bacterium]|nr:glycosyltransferase family 4 protein [Myxococcales bacterium]